MFRSLLTIQSAPNTQSSEVTYTSPFLDKRDSDCSQDRTLVILNSPIQSPPSPLFQRLWNFSSIRICADGGANRLFQSNRQLIPDLIKGDLDSLRPEVSEYYKSKGTAVEQDPSQDTNDLDKALQSALKLSENSLVFVYGAFGGRFDQEMGSIQALYKWSAAFNHNLYLYDDHTCALLVPPGIKCNIKLPFYDNIKLHQESSVGEGPTCGLIPVGCRCEFVMTTGLKWNLDGSTALQFGGLVSTSNRVMEPIATVESSHPLVFTAEVDSGACDEW